LQNQRNVASVVAKEIGNENPEYDYFISGSKVELILKTFMAKKTCEDDSR